MEIEWKSGGIFRISRPSINFWKIAIGKYSGNTENPYEMHKNCFLILPLPIKIVKICWVWTCFLFFIHLQINSQTLLLNVSLVKNICKQTNRDLLNKMCKNFLWNNLLASYKSPVYFTAATHLNAQWSWFRVCTHTINHSNISNWESLCSISVKWRLTRNSLSHWLKQNGLECDYVCLRF